MERIRVYTENTPTIRDLVAQYLEGATVYSGSGLWKGQWEQSLIVEVIAFTESTQQAVNNLVQAIKTIGKQEAVLITREPITAALV